MRHEGCVYITSYVLLLRLPPQPNKRMETPKRSYEIAFNSRSTHTRHRLESAIRKGIFGSFARSEKTIRIHNFLFDFGLEDDFCASRNWLCPLCFFFSFLLQSLGSRQLCCLDAWCLWAIDRHKIKGNHSFEWKKIIPLHTHIGRACALSWTHSCCMHVLCEPLSSWKRQKKKKFKRWRRRRRIMSLFIIFIWRMPFYIFDVERRCFACVAKRKNIMLCDRMADSMLAAVQVGTSESDTNGEIIFRPQREIIIVSAQLWDTCPNKVIILLLL